MFASPLRPDDSTFFLAGRRHQPEPVMRAAGEPIVVPADDEAAFVVAFFAGAKSIGRRVHRKAATTDRYSPRLFSGCSQA